MFPIGLDPADPRGYGAIARAAAALAERTGRLDEAGAWTGRQVVARFFIIGFGNEAQRAALLPRLARGDALLAVAISEPGVGAHPKHLTTRAEPDGDGVRITGRKAWVSNGPDASHFIVLAISAIDGERKRYSAFLVPRETPGLTLARWKACATTVIAYWHSTRVGCRARRCWVRPVAPTKRWRCRSAMWKTRSDCRSWPARCVIC